MPSATVKMPSPLQDPASFFVSIIVALCALVPAIYFVVPLPKEGLWFWYVLIAGFFGIFLWFCDVWQPIKIISVGTFIICFFSKAIYDCFTQYICIVLCCYFYLICSRVKNWKPVINTVITLIILNAFLLFMQMIHKDTLLNFGRLSGENGLGVNGQHMQTASIMTIFIAFLFPHYRSFSLILFPVSWICHSSWTVINLGLNILFRRLDRFTLGIAIIVVIIFVGIEVKYHKLEANLKSTSGRLYVWKQALDYANRYPLTGYGPGTFKIIFPAIQQWPGQRDRGTPYKTAHNFIVQLLFETGYLFTTFILGVVFRLGYRLHKLQLYDELTGLSFIFIDGLVHFPDRMLHTVPLIIAYLAFCNFQIRCHQEKQDAAAAGHTQQ